MRQFNVGQVVTCIPDMFLRHAASGDYKVSVIKENLLVKSEGYLPEEVSKQSFRRRSITLPKLQEA
jgi:hypothetical protein